MYKQKVMRNFFAVVIIALFVLNVITTSISNYTLDNFILKTGALLLFAVFSISYIKFNNGKIIPELQDKNILKVFLILLIISVYTGLTLFYSHNQNYGFIKWLNLIFITIPFVFITIILYKYFIPDKINLILIVFGIISLLMSCFIIFFLPFDYSGEQYFITFERWSHVVSGRILSLFLLCSLISLIFINNKKLFLFNSAVFIITAIALYVTGLRAAITGFIIIIPILFILIFLRKEFRKKLIPTIVLLAAVLTLIFILPLPSEKAELRLNNLSEISNLEFGNDGAIQARLKGWEIAKDMYLENPIFGVGIGGYNQFYKSGIPQVIKYPHNFFIELIVEYGILGIAGSLFILLIVIKSLLKLILNQNSFSNFDFYLLTTEFLLLFFLLWLGMFSKDFATQNIIYFFMLLPIIQKRKTSLSQN